MNVEEEVERLREEIKRLGKIQDDGSYKEARPNDKSFEDEKCEYLDQCLDAFYFAVQGGWAIARVTFGVLFHDDRCANIFEALVGTLRAAKKRKFLSYDGELLLQGVHDNVEIILKPTPAATPTDAVVKN